MGPNNEERFRGHFRCTFSDRTDSFDQFRQYYLYGMELADYKRYQNCSWKEVERTARLDWKISHPDMAWTEVREAVKTGWETAVKDTTP